MLERHDSDCVCESERDQKDNCEDRQDDEAFSPRDYQEGFWS